MIIIYDLKIIETHNKKRFHRLYSYKTTPGILGEYIDGDDGKAINVTTEMVEGKRFRNYLGLDVVIGCDEQSQKLLGLPFSVFEAQERRRESDYKENTKLREKIRKLEERSLWQIIKDKLYL